MRSRRIVDFFVNNSILLVLGAAGGLLRPMSSLAATTGSRTGCISSSTTSGCV
jgi:hypothetical protein